MEESEQISLRQFIYIIFVSRTILGIAYGNAEIERQDIVISTVVGLLLALLIKEIMCKIMKEFPGKSYIQCLNSIFGWFGSGLALIYVVYFIYKDSLSIAMFNALISTTVLPETPNIFLSITFMMAVVYGASKGLETIGRVSEIVGVIIIIAFISIFLLIYKDIDFHNYLPLLENGPMPIVKGSIVTSLRTIEIVFAAIIAPSLSDENKLRKGYNIAFILCWSSFMLIVICALGVFGINQAITKAFPYFSVVKFANAFNFIERIQAIHIGIWVLGAYIKLALSIYVMALSLSQIFNLKDFKSLMIPLGLMMIPLNQELAARNLDIRTLAGSPLDVIASAVFVFLIPLIMLIVMKLKKCVFNKV